MEKHEFIKYKNFHEEHDCITFDDDCELSFYDYQKSGKWAIHGINIDGFRLIDSEQYLKDVIFWLTGKTIKLWGGKNDSTSQSNCILSDVSKCFTPELRSKFYAECTTETPKQQKLKKINLAPHDLFEWFKRNIC